MEDGKPHFPTISVIEPAEFVHGGGRLLRRNAFETNDGRSPGPEFDHFVVSAFELSGVAARALAESVKAFENVRSEGSFPVR